MKADALHDLIRDVDDRSSPEHKAIFHLWSALDSLLHDRKASAFAKARAERLEAGRDA